MNPVVEVAGWEIFIHPAFQVRFLLICKQRPFTHEKALSDGFA